MLYISHCRDCAFYSDDRDQYADGRGLCNRFPEPIVKKATDFCGEFLAEGEIEFGQGEVPL